MKKNTFLLFLAFALAGSLVRAHEGHDHSTSPAPATAPAAERIPAKGYAMFSADGGFKPLAFTRHALGDDDVLIEILYSGICHSDIHSVRGEWRGTTYPVVPGHEIVGRVTRVGKNVTKFKVGDHAGVGCMVNACGECASCQAGEEQYCERGPVFTYGMPDRFHGGEITQGGYADNIVIASAFAVKIPEGADLKRVAPLLCAGITTYSPLRRAKIGPGSEIAVAGFGGLGHMAVKYAVDFGAKVTVFDITEAKRADALAMGAARYVNVNSPAELKDLRGRFDYVLSTIPAPYDPILYANMLKRTGEFVNVGLPANDKAPTFSVNTLVYMQGRKFSGSMIGGIRETQEVVDYSVARKIYPDVELIPIQQLDDAYAKIIAGDVKFRYVIDMASLK